MSNSSLVGLQVGLQFPLLKTNKLIIYDSPWVQCRRHNIVDRLIMDTNATVQSGF